MLAPGELLTTPPPPPGETGAPAEGHGPEPQPPATAAAPDEPETRSFLMTLLRALGAVHT